MSSIGEAKDNTSTGERYLSVVFIVIYSVFWAYSGLQLYRHYNCLQVFRLIHSLIFTFLLRTSYSVRLLFWFDIFIDYPDAVYFTLQSFPNFILYNIGQVICYIWSALPRLRCRFDLAKNSRLSYKAVKTSLVAFNAGADLIYFIALLTYYSAGRPLLNISLYLLPSFIVVYNCVIALLDFTLLVYSGWKLLSYINVYCPLLRTKKVTTPQITLSIWASAVFYLGRSCLVLSLVMKGNYNESTDQRVLLKLMYYLITDLVFLVFLNLLVKVQESQDSDIQKYTERLTNTIVSS
jgi:hypothetical protein